jgi:hypothetical protein
MNRFVSLFYMLGFCVGIGIHRDGTNAELSASTDNPAGDFTTVGD